MLEITRRHVLLGSAAMLGAAALVRGSAKAEPTSAPKNLVLVVGYGGWDTTYVFDPKPGHAAIDAPRGNTGTSARLLHRLRASFNRSGRKV